jgi:hypothetical protein
VVEALLGAEAAQQRRERDGRAVHGREVELDVERRVDGGV